MGCFLQNAREGLPVYRPIQCFLILLTAAAWVGCGSSSGNGYTLSASPGVLSLVAGGTAQLTEEVSAAESLKQPVKVVITGLPAGVTASPASATLAAGGRMMVTLTAAGTAAPGTASITVAGTANGMARSTTVALTVTAPAAAAPDFTLTASPAAATIVPSGTGAQVSLLAAAVHGFSSTVLVNVSGLPPGVAATPSSVNLTPGVAQTVSLAADASAAAGPANITFTGFSNSTSHTAPLVLTVGVAAVPSPSTAPDVTTYHYDNTREGWNRAETVLTPENVNPQRFGLLGVYPVDGKVDAAPLYVGGLKLGSGTTDVLYVATEHDSVYALNAGTGTQIWKSSILGMGETPSDSRGCGQISPEIGITSTPVIERSSGPNGAMFVVGMSKGPTGAYHHRLHALDLLTGTELPGSPTEIEASYPGTGENASGGKVVFDPGQYAERVGLTAVNGTIYMGWTSHCDIQPYTGWVMGYSEQTLKQTTVLNLTPNGSEGAIWMSGYGIAADTGGNLYLADANGTLDSGFTANGFPSQMDFGNALLKLGTAGGLSVADFFEPYNTVQESAMDLDLGSGGAMLLPDLTDSAGKRVQLVVGGGKDNNLYVADRNSMGKFNANGRDNSNVYQEIPGAFPNGEWGGPAYFTDTVYYGGVNDTLKAYTIRNGRFSAAPTSQSVVRFHYPGTTPSVSSNGAQDGIVWAVESAQNAPAVLHAYDAADLGHELYNSGSAANGRDAFGNGNKFITPVVVNGRVFVGTPGGVAVFGLLSASAPGQ